MKKANKVKMKVKIAYKKNRKMGNQIKIRTSQEKEEILTNMNEINKEEYQKNIYDDNFYF